jgi:hypothetical protein
MINIAMGKIDATLTRIVKNTNIEEEKFSVKRAKVYYNCQIGGFTGFTNDRDDTFAKLASGV